MDAIDDTAMAMASYVSLPVTDDKGELYIRVYGLMQSLFVQQHAVVHAAEALGLDTNVLETTAEIRHMRNAAVGHPSKKNRGPERGAFGIIQASLCASSFQWYSFDLESWKNGGEPRTVEISRLIHEQEGHIIRAIEDLIKKVENMGSAL